MNVDKESTIYVLLFDILGATTDGGMTEQMYVPEHCLVSLDKNMDKKFFFSRKLL